MEKHSRRRRRPRALALCALAASALGTAGCDDTSPEPEGPLLVRRLTLFDEGSRDVPVFTDTSSPTDCGVAPARDSERCQSDPFRDRFGTRLSPPTPDSGGQIRVVFNKLPLRIGGKDLERITLGPDKLPTDISLSDDSAVDLRCDAQGPQPCAAAPPVAKRTQLGGSPASPDPTTFPYGPALQLTVTPDAGRPLAALEPATAYEVVLSPALAGRDGVAVQLDAAARQLLRFTTEPFKLLRGGIGDDDADAWIYAPGAAQQGTDAAPYRIEGLASDGVIRLRANAALDDSVWRAGTFTAATGAGAVEVRATLSQLAKDDMTGALSCDAGDHRSLYLFPAAMDGAWGAQPAGTELRLTIEGGDLRDISQAQGHPAGQGRHVLPGRIVIVAVLSGHPADNTYLGLTSDAVRAAADCP